MKQVKALLYRVDICDSTLEMVHGMKYSIAELFVPNAKLVLNEKGGAFYNKSPRDSNCVEIKIPQKLVTDTKKLIANKTKSKIEKLFLRKSITTIAESLRKKPQPAHDNVTSYETTTEKNTDVPFPFTFTAKY